MEATEQAVQVIEAGRYASRTIAFFELNLQLIVILAGGIPDRYELALDLTVADGEERLFRFVDDLVDWHFFIERNLANVIRGLQHSAARGCPRDHLCVDLRMDSRRRIVDQAGQIGLAANLIEDTHVLQFTC